ncbi:MAG: glycosyltransferase [Candidatus Eisenbacteria bacterium]
MPPSRAERPVRLVYLTGKLGIGGSEVHLARLVLGLDRRRFPAEVIVCHAGGVFEERVIAAGVPVHDINVGQGYPGIVRGVLDVRRILGQVRPQLFQTYGFTCDLLGTLAVSPWSQTKLVTTRRGNEGNRKRQLLYGLMNRVARQVLCVSEAARAHAERTEGLDSRRAEVIPNGLDLDPYLAVSRPARPVRVLGTVGRLRKIKGSDLLLDAFSRLNHPELTLRIAGPIFEDETLTRELWGKQLYDAHKDNPRVDFVGEIHDIPDFHGAIDLFILPSRSEGMSNALIEAMASGLPIIATNVGGNPETLGHGEAGLLVEPNAGAIAAAITRLMEHPEEARALGLRARERAVREYRLETMVRRYEQLYQRLLHGTG